ncbi:uncharacterized protein BDR25DRAFT_219429 [Lindgomyces ingoldianus]|uniref:Uncharacterized protein n=1 Tax=Lindgomyces ingoldianus TaxID=673940 RepID=A0ACB6R3E9_9PLEO|nr:uncharacterized protein BDR25DRAFT_219429 [Lindgomyces ingoldianus]KAF2472852.1 hypothetical protein BDR25DRAFT_219429 [Lindgomyces ingoldianus]
MDKSLPEKPLPVAPNVAPLPAYTVGGPSIPGFQTRFASLSLHMEDRLRFLRFPPDVVNTCRQTIVTTWKRGIQGERVYAGSYEFKTMGHPWRGAGDEAMEARRLVCALLGTLHTMGWVLTLNTDVSKSVRDKDTLLFRHQIPAPAECEWGCVAFSKTDRIRFIDLPPEICGAVASKIDQSWVKEQSIYMQGVYEIRLHGSPWYSNGTDTMKVRELLLVLLETLEEEGWTVYASIDQKNGTENTTETDTWHCSKPKGWVKGTPVYHS